MLRWFLFCDTGASSFTRLVVDSSADNPCDRRRLLCWVVLCTLVWTHISHTFWNFVALISSCLSLLVNVVTNAGPRLSETIRSVCNLTLVIGLVSAAAVLSYQPWFLRYEYLVKKLALKEYDIWRCRCSSTYITLVGVTVISCVVRGIHKRLGL
ncbi:unnamed protein product [Candidula unifasciata]|uniref:Uncharacterized protein n=1 Tax=Candidula unifasciata TaxID=100452 RepID=A0A8S4A0I8_9EUPU|nr:unnamed protein product [Candidula unifasciata]